METTLYVFFKKKKNIYRYLNQDFMQVIKGSVQND